ncbi:MAG: hypothetical protein ABI454_13060 [Sphingomicrobium sp.]
MRFSIATAFALIAASSLHAQTAAPVLDLSTAAPIAGSWFYSQTPGASEASFLNASALPQLTIRCTRATRRVTISKPANRAVPFLTVWTSAQTRAVPASFSPATQRLSAELAASDALLDAIAFSRGRFGVSVSGAAALVVPAWAESQRVIEDCRV